MRYVESLREITDAPEAELMRLSNQIEQDWAWKAGRLEKVRSRQFSGSTDVLRWIVEARESHDLDEALWRCFFGSHFGEPLGNPSAARSAGEMLCAYGAEPVWTWIRVRKEPAMFLKWLLENRKILPEIQFSNHRKYEAKDPKLFYDVVWGFVLWVINHGGSPAIAFATDVATPEEKFDVLFNRLASLPRFGRLAVYDLLCLISDLDLLPITPGSCYLAGATGPLDGARRLWGKKSSRELSVLADQAAVRLGVPFPVFEDALCNWQK